MELEAKLGQLNLDNICLNLNKACNEKVIDPIIGMDDIVNQMVHVLSRRKRNIPLLLGEHGVGKTSAVYALVFRILNEQVPSYMKDWTIYQIDASSILAGASAKGEVEERVNIMFEQLQMNQNALLFIDEFHQLAKAKGDLPITEIIKSKLAFGNCKLILATTYDDFRRHLQQDRALVARLQPIYVYEPSIEECIEILKGIKYLYEEFHGISVSDDILAACTILSSRYIHDANLPAKAIDVMDQSMALVKARSQLLNLDLKALVNAEELTSEVYDAIEMALLNSGIQNNELFEKLDEAKRAFEASKITKARKLSREVVENINSNIFNATVTDMDVAWVVSRKSKIPIHKITAGEKEKLAKLEETLKERVKGQDHAIKVLADAVKRGRLGLHYRKRPVANFLFVGPTGVGKTETAKALAEAMFGDETKLVRIDMSEYIEPHSISRLYGSPPGYVGYEEGGQLTEAVRKNPYCVVLLDEIDKAASTVTSALLDMLEDGRMTDGRGNIVDFSNCIIIFTSNFLTSTLGEVNDANYDKQYEKVMKFLSGHLRLEFLNRIDAVVLFKSLSRDTLRDIAQYHLQRVIEVLEREGVSLEYDNEIVDYLIEHGYQPEMGARPLLRVITDKILNPAAGILVQQPVGRIYLKMGDGEIIVTGEGEG